MSSPFLRIHALELAKSGQYANLDELRRALAAEGYPSTAFLSRVEMREIERLCLASRVPIRTDEDDGQTPRIKAPEGEPKPR